MKNQNISLLICSLLFSVSVNIGLFIMIKASYNESDRLRNLWAVSSTKNFECRTDTVGKEIQYLECKEQSRQYSILYNAMNEVGKIPYDRTYANCYDHSKLLQKKLAENNIASSIFVAEERTHAWIAVWIESTTGQFIPSEDMYDVLEVRDGKLKVICK